jgi:hypothetical protein
MNAPMIDRMRLKEAVRAVEQRYTLTIMGILPDGVVGHPSGRDPNILLANGAADLSLVDLCAAEIELEDRLGTPTRIILQSELKGKRGAAIAAQLRPL